METEHKFILLTKNPKKGLNTEAGFLVVDHYFKTIKQTREKWRKEKKLLNVNWTEHNGEKKKSIPVNYLKIAEHIRETGSFNPFVFNLPIMECFWLDHSLDMKLNFHITDHTGTLGLVSGTPQQQYGDKYPIKPNLQREGHLYTTFQPQLLKRIISQRTKLIQTSNFAVKDDWVFDLRTLVSDTISLIDITLTQFYIKAEYDPLPGWRFDKKRLGERHGRRLSDKFKWIFQVTGNNLDIESELTSLNMLKELRNHLMHFDPPSLIITLEEATIWLNQIIDIGIILIKIRKAIKSEISLGLVNYILQREAVFVPINQTRKRKPVGENPNEDYYSATWPK
ncbi:MAG: hypothetical protein V2A54_03235 [Bacteroidota bacterium]